MALRCDACGLESSLEEVFQRRRRIFRRARHVCPRCAWERQLRELGGGLALDALILAAAGAALVSLGHAAGWAILNFLLVILFLIVTAPLHEAGHALAARGLGLRVLLVVLGLGGALGRSSVAGVTIEWRRIPFGGLTVVVPETESALAPRLALTMLAGPAVDGLLLALALFALGGISGFAGLWSASTSGFAPVLSLAAASGLSLVANLVPHTSLSAVGPVGSDGLQLLQSLRAGPEQRRAWLVSRYLGPAALAWEQGRWNEAMRWAELGLDRFPDEPGLRLLRGALLMEEGTEGALERARELHLALLRGAVDPATRALCLNNVAYADFLLARDELLDEAERCSEEAAAVLPWIAAVQGTRGAVLVWADRAEEGVDWLARARRGAERPADRARVDAAMALGEAQLGRLEEAKRHLERVRASDPGCLLLERVVRATDSASAAHSAPTMFRNTPWWS